MKQQTRYPGCEEHEIPIGHLSPGAVFVLDLGRGKRNGIVVSRNAGSVTVEWQNGAAQHCCVDCPVVPTGLIQDVEQWIQNQKSNNEANEMDTKKGKTNGKAKKQSRSRVSIPPAMRESLRKYRHARSTVTQDDRDQISKYRELLKGARKSAKKKTVKKETKTAVSAVASFRVRKNKK